jgi:hypothetical protein
LDGYAFPEKESRRSTAIQYTGTHDIGNTGAFVIFSIKKPLLLMMVNELFTVLHSLYWCRDGILAIVSYIKRVNYATDCLEFSTGYAKALDNL